MEFVPDKMAFEGNVTTKNNSVGFSTNNWITDMPDGSIILGVNPTSCNPNDWHGATATLQFNVESKSFPIIGVLKISWPDTGGKGLHSPYKGKTALIKFDGETIWSKRVEILGSNNNLFAAEYECVQTTVVLRNSGPHHFTLIIPEKTAWDISRVELLLDGYPKNVRGIGYSPYRDCQYPNDNRAHQPTIEEVKEDLVLLSNTCNAIRTYSSTGINGKIPAIAKSLGLKVFAGASIDGSFEESGHDSLELRSLIDIADTVDVDGVIVGNEYYLRHVNEPDAIRYLQKCIIQVKEEIKKKNVPITTAEIYPFVLNKQYQKILDVIGGIFVHIYPFWGRCSINGAVDITIKRYKEVKDSINRLYPGGSKFVMIGETGWPSDGENLGEAEPSPANQRRYLHEFMNSADVENIDYMYFDAFDELWKASEGLLGQHWGYSYSDRSAKYGFYGLLIPPHLVPDGRVDLPSKEPIHNGISNTYQILDEWPRRGESFKITEESINRMREQNISDTLLGVLKKFLDREYFDQRTFLGSVMTAFKGAGIQVQERKAEADHGDNQSSSLGEEHSGVERLISKYSGYHYFSPRFMGDIGKITMDECDRCCPASGEMATSITFSFDGENKWCGICWLPSYDFENGGNAELKWEDLPGVNIYEKLNADDGSPAVLTFYARGEEGGEKIRFSVGGIGKKK